MVKVILTDDMRDSLFCSINYESGLECRPGINEEFKDNKYFKYIPEVYEVEQEFLEEIRFQAYKLGLFLAKNPDCGVYEAIELGMDKEKQEAASGKKISLTPQELTTQINIQKWKEQK